MAIYKIDNKNIELDSTKTYLDFYICNNEQKLVSLDLESLLKSIESGKILVDNKLQNYMTYLQRWTTDAPRKKYYRQMRKEGFTILSCEQFFEEEGGDKIIDNLENTGKFADYFLKQVYNK